MSPYSLALLGGTRILIYKFYDFSKLYQITLLLENDPLTCHSEKIIYYLFDQECSSHRIEIFDSDSKTHIKTQNINNTKKGYVKSLSILSDGNLFVLIWQTKSDHIQSSKFRRPERKFTLKYNRTKDDSESKIDTDNVAIMSNKIFIHYDKYINIII